MAVKSWWRLRDAGILLEEEVCRNYLKTAEGYKSKLAELSTDELHTGPQCSGSHLTFDRQITNVEIQSDTRAIVTAQIKNTTPPEEGAVLDYEDKKAKEAGEPYRYVLERESSSSQWKIAQVLSMPSYAKTWVEALKAPPPANNRWVFESFQ
jgi:hypothetical protein